MAQRWTGNLAIRITYVDRDDNYKATVCRIAPTRRERNCETVFVGAPRYLERAVDHPASYDEATRAAISFLESDLSEEAEYLPDGSAVRIYRKRPRR